MEAISKQASASAHPSERLPRIAFVGPIAEPGKPAGGGYEAANRRTIDLLRQRGMTVLEFPYPVARGAVVRKSATYALRFAEIAGKLMWRRKDWDVLHITPHLRQFITAENWVCQIARKLSRPVLLDIRAGSLISDYDERGAGYRREFERFIASADLLAIEGMAYAPFVRRWYNKDIFYFPNYVAHRKELKNISRQAPDQDGAIRLATVGRLVPAKGVELAIDLTEHLHRAGVRVDLEVIGTGEAAYVEHLKMRSRSLPVSFTGALPTHDIFGRLATRHFFIFATTHFGEGHSNALTEAMALGVVPICSDNGFNREVVGNAGMVVPKTASVEIYADAVQTIALSNGAWLSASQAVFERVQHNFTDQIVIPQLLDKYLRLLGNDTAMSARSLQSAA